MDGWKMKFPFVKPNFQLQTVSFREDNSTLMDDRDACQVMTLRPDPSFLEYMSAVAVWWPQVDTKKGTCETWWKLVILNSCKKTTQKIEVFNVEISPNPIQNHSKKNLKGPHNLRAAQRSTPVDQNFFTGFLQSGPLLVVNRARL